MQLRDRINLGFAITVSLALLLGLLGQFALNRNASGFQKITGDTAPGLQALGEVRGQIFRVIAESISLVLLFESSTPGSTVREAIAEEEGELAEAWDALDRQVFRAGPGDQDPPEPQPELELPLTPAEARRLQSDLLQFRALTDEILAEARSGRLRGDAERVLEFKEASEDIEDDLEDLLRTAVARQQAELAREEQSAQETVNLSGQLFFAAAVCILGFVVYFGVSVNRRLIRPLAQLQAATGRVAAREELVPHRDLPAMPEDRRRADEIASLSGALYELDQRLRASMVSRDYINAILESMSDMLFVLDEEHRILTVNPAVSTTLGRTADELRGQLFADLIPAQSTDAFETDFSIEVLLSSGQPTRIALATDGDPVPVALAVAGMPIGDLRGAVCVARDIREDLLKEAALLEAREQVEVASRARSEFLMNLSHEIRTPLHSVIGLSDLLEETELDAEQVSLVTSLSRASSALLQLINNFLDLSRIESGRLQLRPGLLKPRDFVRNLEAIYGPQARSKGLEFRCGIGGQMTAQLRIDGDLLNQVMGNLIGNAIKFTEHGFVRMQLRRLNETELELTVEDTGVGVPPERAAAIFEAFEQADNSITRNFGGTGLGLAISRQLVNLLGGQIALEKPESGQGSCFRVQLPCEFLSDDSAAANGPAARTPLKDPGPLRVLLVEDNENNQMLIRAFLKRTSVNLEIAEHGGEALDRVRGELAADAQRLPFDVILMDMQMPVMDGYQATRALRELEAERELSRAPVIALTAHAMEDAQERSLSAGCDEHVIKPISKADLLELLARYAKA